jgi:hypothetical protein
MAPPEVKVRRAAATAGLDPVGDELHDLVEVVPSQLRIRRGAAHQREEVVLAPLLGGALRDDLLRQDVQGGDRRMNGVEAPGTHPGHQRGALHELVAGQRIQAPLRGASAAVPRPANALEEGRQAAGRADLAHELDGADVDAQLERGGRHERAQIAGPQAPLDPEPALLGETAVMRGDHVLADTLAEQMGDALGEPPGVDEHKRGPMRQHVGGDAVENLRQLLGRSHRLQLAVRKLDGEVEIAPVTGVDDDAPRAALGTRALGAGADQEPGNALDGALRRGEPDALGPPLADVLEALERECQVRPALVSRRRVDLVDDDRVHRPEHGSAPLRR